MRIDLASLQRLGQGRAAEVFALDESRVIKVAREGASAALDREAAAMRAAHAAGLPVPAAHELVEVGGRHALIMGRAAGTDMLTNFARKPWTLLRAGRKLGRLHARLHDAVAPAELPAVRDVIEKRVTESTIAAAARDRVLEVLRTLPDGDRLCHLDFHPGNVLTDGTALVVIDWPGACRGDPVADVAATLVALRGGQTTPGTPLITRLFAPIGRRLLLGGYRRGYGRVDPDRLAAWMIVLSGMRLTYAIAGEDDALLAAILS